MNEIEKPKIKVSALREIDYTFTATDGHHYRVNFTRGEDKLWRCTVYVEYQHGEKWNMSDKIGHTITYRNLKTPSQKLALSRLT